jgi:hypothetical protein
MRCLLRALVPVILASSSIAQSNVVSAGESGGADRVPDAARLFQPDRSRVYLDRPGDGPIWARGAHYKAGFEADGAVFYPLFGPRQTAHLPLAFHFKGLGAGTSEVEFADSVAPVLQGRVIEYRRGPVVEEYEVGSGQVEQRFRFQKPLPPGELVLRLEVATELAFAGAAGGLAFESPGLGRVHYGEATAIDAAGGMQACAVRFVDGAIEIRVPEPFLTEEAYPLTIDPILLFVPVDVRAALDHVAADIAYDATADRYTVTYEEIAVAGVDHDILCSSFTGTGALAVAAGDYQELGTGMARAPAIANNNLHDMNLVVFEYSPNSAGPTDIIGRRVTNFGFNVAGVGLFMIAGGPNRQRHPDVGGDPHLIVPPDTLWFVVWEEVVNVGADHDVLGTVVDAAAVVGLPVEVDGFAGALVDRNPRMTSSCGLRGRWGVVWARGFDMMLRDVRYDGTLGVAPVVVNAPSGGDTNPSVGGNGSRFLVLWERQIAAGDRNLWGRRANLGGLGWAFPGATVDVTTGELAAGFGGVAPPVLLTRDQFDPSVDTDGSKFVYAYSESEFGNLQIYAGCLRDAAAGALAWDEPRVVVDVGAFDEQRTEVVAMAGAGGSRGLYGFAWDEEVAAGNGDIRGARYQCGAVLGGPFPYHPTACGGANAPVVDASGIPAPGGAVAFTLTTPTSAIPLLWIGVQTSTPLCSTGSCTLGASMLSVQLTTAWSIPIPQVPEFVGSVWSVQGAAVFTSGGCLSGTIPYTVSDTIDFMIQ